MSDTTEEQLLKLVPLVRWLLGGALTIGLWVGTLEMRQSAYANTQAETSIAIKNHGAEINRIILWQAEKLSNLYTASEALRDDKITQLKINELDKRQAHIEDAALRLEKAVERIEDKLGTRQ